MFPVAVGEAREGAGALEDDKAAQAVGAVMSETMTPPQSQFQFPI